MPPLSLFQLLPLHITEMIIDHLANSNQVLANGITSDSAKHKLLLLPLLWVCRNFREVSSLNFYNVNTIKIKGDDYETDSAQYWWFKRLKKFYSSTHHLAREIHILLDKSGFFAGKTLEALSRAPFDGCAFPNARKLIFTFYTCRAYDGVAPGDAEVTANISALVQRVKLMAPMICEVEVVGTSNPVNLPSEHTRINDFLSQIFQLVPRVVYKGSEDNIPLGLPAVEISHLVHIDIDFDSNSLYKPLFRNLAQWNVASQLVHQNAMTLQYLSIGTYAWAHITGLVRDANGNFVTYPRLSVLKLNYTYHTYEHYWPVFAEVVPFPRLRQLTISGKCPFGDDILFRGNTATLKCLDISLDSGMVIMLKRYNVFTSISHPKLRCVKIRLEPGVGVEQFETDTARLQFMLDIGPAATVRELKGTIPSHWLFPEIPVFANYTNIQLLVLTDTRLTLWNTIVLIDMLPLLSELYSQSPVVSPLPAKVTKDGLLDYVVATHVSMSKTFRCWHITYEDKWVTGGETILCVLLLALICPNFDYVFAGSNRDLFMTHLKVAMAAEAFLPYAARLQRLLPGRPANENSDIKAI